MIKFLLAALTTLFVFVMPFATAYAQGAPSAGDCTTFEMLYSADEIAAAEAQGLEIIKLDTQETAKLVKSLVETFGTEPPFAITNIIVFRKDGGDLVYLLWFDGKCHQGTGRLPAQVVNPLLGQKS